jgi:predicted DNA-binding protein with PD1-like motif
MKHAEATQGRVFVIRLEDGEILHEEIERFAKEQGVRAAALVAVGGAGAGSRLVVGPKDRSRRPIEPMVAELSDTHEAAGTGTLFPDEEGNPRLHMHVAAGRGDATTTGCARTGLRVWQTMEIVMIELVGEDSIRRFDAGVGFAMLEPS